MRRMNNLKSLFLAIVYFLTPFIAGKQITCDTCSSRYNQKFVFFTPDKINIEIDDQFRFEQNPWQQLCDP